MGDWTNIPQTLWQWVKGSSFDKMAAITSTSQEIIIKILIGIILLWICYYFRCYRLDLNHIRNKISHLNLHVLYTRKESDQTINSSVTQYSLRSSINKIKKYSSHIFQRLKVKKTSTYKNSVPNNTRHKSLNKEIKALISDIDNLRKENISLLNESTECELVPPILYSRSFTTSDSDDERSSLCTR